MFTRNRIFAVVVLCVFSTLDNAAEPGPTSGHPTGPNLGRPISAADLAPWDITVFPSGRGLPAGSGTAAKGAPVFATYCAACHGDKGQGGLGPVVVSDRKREGIDEGTTTIANFWPYATTLFDYIRRAMPWQSPRTMTDDQAYALTAFILASNKLIDPDFVIDAKSLPTVRMPNRNGFLDRFPKLVPSDPPR